MLDLIATGAFGDESKRIIIDKINTWFQRINSEPDIQKDISDKWLTYIKDNQDTYIKLPHLETATKDVERIKTNLAITSVYNNILDRLNSITRQDSSRKTKEEILNNLIYEYEGAENKYQKDNFYNNLLIECKGNREEADRLFEKQQAIFEEDNNILNLLTNIIINKDAYKVSNETQKIAVGFMKQYILNSIQELEKDINNDEFKIEVNGFTTTTTDGKNIEEVKRDINTYVNNYFPDNDNSIIIPLIIINILGIIGLFVTLNHKTLNILLIIVIIVGNILLFSKLNKVTKLRNESKQKLRNELNLNLERILAETIDYKNLQQEDYQKRNELMILLENIKPENFMYSNNERNIDIGE